MLGVVPRGTETEDCPAAADDVERRDLLRQHRGIAIRHTGDERAERARRRRRGERAEERVPLEHGLGAATERGQLVEVVHHPQRFEAAVFGGAGEVDDVGEDLAVVATEGEVGDLEPERGHVDTLARGRGHVFGTRLRDWIGRECCRWFL